ncbi:hypothetical protein CRE_15820 [Caenorhabditis remanei]|uniref:Uncharacterized protein n=1 Tax=Caenorhabditis remanei TaxID=31234 RepID=E3NQD8_CAERE|nr:hypothetical protein CRE_15820 [Caenorhabditis remanei]
MAFYSKYSVQLCVDKKMGISINGTDELVSCLYVTTSDKRMDGKSADEKDDGYIIERTKETIDVLLMTMDAFVDQNVSIIDFFKANVKSVNECNLFQWNEGKDVDEHCLSPEKYHN